MKRRPAPRTFKKTGCRCERGGTCDVSHNPAKCPCRQCRAGARRKSATKRLRKGHLRVRGRRSDPSRPLIGPKTLAAYARSREAKARFKVHRLHVDRGGYTHGGRSYFGSLSGSEGLFEIEDDVTGRNYIRRATSATEARMKVIVEERPDLSLRRR
jgi:hypothetical protein